MYPLIDNYIMLLLIHSVQSTDNKIQYTISEPNMQLYLYTKYFKYSNEINRLGRKIIEQQKN